MKRAFGYRIALPVLAVFLLTGAGAHGETVANLLIGLSVIVVGAKLGAEIFERARQPAVLGELLFGVILGNLAWFGFDGLEFIRRDEVILALSEIGVILLLFEVGLESSVGEMFKVGKSAMLVALLGVVTPFLLGWGLAKWFLPESNPLVHVFVGATLTATSVGITARVLNDLGQIHSPEARVILGAAVIDDVLGLVILAVVSGVIAASAGGKSLQAAPIVAIILKAFLFVAGTIAAGHFMAPALFKAAALLKTRGILLATSITLCFLLAWLAYAIGLAFIVGAFVAGLILQEAHYRELAAPQRTGEHAARIEDLLHPIAGFLVPVFFVRTGMDLDLRAFGELSVLGFAGVLTLAAVLGKQACAWGVLEPDANRLAVGLGMIPRGEVGLIFANIGAGLVLPGGEAVVGSGTFGAIVIMVGITTMATPPLLKWSLRRKERKTD